jgi:hypothetical protein
MTWSAGGQEDLGVNAVAYGSVPSTPAPAPAGSCRESFASFVARGGAAVASPIPGVKPVVTKQSTVDPTWGYIDYGAVDRVDTKTIFHCGASGWIFTTGDVDGNCNILKPTPPPPLPPPSVMRDLGLTC